MNNPISNQHQQLRHSINTNVQNENPQHSTKTPRRIHRTLPLLNVHQNQYNLKLFQPFIPPRTLNQTHNIPPGVKLNFLPNSPKVFFTPPSYPTQQVKFNTNSRNIQSQVVKRVLKSPQTQKKHKTAINKLGKKRKRTTTRSISTRTRGNSRGSVERQEKKSRKISIHKYERKYDRQAFGLGGSLNFERFEKEELIKTLEDEKMTRKKLIEPPKMKVWTRSEIAKFGLFNHGILINKKEKEELRKLFSNFIFSISVGGKSEKNYDKQEIWNFSMNLLKRTPQTIYFYMKENYWFENDINYSYDPEKLLKNKIF